MKGNFGEDLYVPDFLTGSSAHIEFDTPDMGLQDIAEPDDEELFDYDRTDNRATDRYTRPRPARVPSACVRYDNAKALAREVKLGKGQRVDAFIGGTFVFGDFIEAWLTHNKAQAKTMTIGTLSLSEENVNSLYLLLSKHYIGELRLMVSHYFYRHERRGLIPYIIKKLDIENRFQFAVAWIHTKTCHFDLADGRKIVIHGSANLRSNANIENVTFEENPELFDFYDETYAVLFSEYNVINRRVRDTSSWKKFERSLFGGEVER